MNILDRLYWFSRNLWSFTQLLLVMPVLLLIDLIGITTLLFTTDGSVEIMPPWEQIKEKCNEYFGE